MSRHTAPQRPKHVPSAWERLELPLTYGELPTVYSEMAHTIHDTEGTHDRGERQSEQEGHAHQDTRGGSVVSECPVKTYNPICHLTVTIQPLNSRQAATET